ncbi:ABC-type Fe3+-hydroxamate transport system, periplasmic component [Phyllobacterium sp. YR531]|nr:ABC-type Fe3+-hydroxamate transport system, periplasmic component [Phyllobacterium sp. YR531]
MLALSMAAILPARFAYAQEQRVAIIDWAMLETALAIGIVPVAATELLQFRSIAIEPEVPTGVADLGLRGTPNFEMLRLAAPDIILSSNFYEYRRAHLERVAPVFSMTVYQPGTPPYGLAEKVALGIGDKLGRATKAAAYVTDTSAMMIGLRKQLQAKAISPVFVINIGDARHFRAFGADSMFGDVVARLGFKNAWGEKSSYSATAPVGIEALARVPEASIIIVGPIPPEAEKVLPQSALWNALPAVKAGRVVKLQPVNHFGGLPAARRFARLVAGSSLFSNSINNG